MKLYTDSTGKFQMYIPVKWQYKNPSFYKKQEKAPQAFGVYGEMLGAFQISCKQVTEHISELINTRKEPIQSSDNKLLFSELKQVSGDKIVYMFTCAVDDHFLFATYIFEKKDEGLPEYQAELLEVQKVLSSVKFIKPQYRDKVISLRRYNLFMIAIATTIDLMNKAIENGSFIEYVALAANRIDALLRLSIILKKQIGNKNDEIDDSLLFQSESDKPIMERAIYKLALNENIIDQGIFDKLESLYIERNKVIHRFVITDIRTEDIIEISVQYSYLMDDIDLIVNNLEKEQVTLGVGINANNKDLGVKPSGNELDRLIVSIKDKHGNIEMKDILGEKVD